MKGRNKLILFALLSLPLLLMWPSNSASALDKEIGLALKPAILELTGDPGQTVSTEISIQNISSNPIGVEVGSRSLLPNDAEIDQNKRKDYDASTWLITKEIQLLLDTDEIQQVPVQFLIPPDAGPGGHYSLITFKTLGEGIADTTTAQVSPELTTLALITVSGDIVESTEIMPLEVPLFAFGGEHHVEFEIANNGNVHLLPTATVNLYDRSDELVETQFIQSQLVLPNTIKDYNIDWQSNGRVGLHRLEVQISYGTPSQVITLNSGALWLMPDAPTMAFWLFGGLILIYIVVFRGKILWKKLWSLTAKFRYRVGNKRRRLVQTDNLPQEIAKLSFSSQELDDIISPPKRTIRQQTKTVNLRPLAPQIKPRSKPKRIKIR